MLNIYILKDEIHMKRMSQIKKILFFYFENFTTSGGMIFTLIFQMYRDHVMYDHIWGDREINSKEIRRRKALQYEEDLKRQIAEKNARNGDNGSGSYHNGMRNSYGGGRTGDLYDNYDRNFQRNYGSNQRNSKLVSTYSPSYQSPSASSVPSNSFSSTLNTYSGIRNSGFTESLRAQIDAASRSGSTTEVSIPPLSTVTPTVPAAFSAATRFDDAKFEFTPNMTRSWRNYGGGSASRISPVSMYSTSSVRSQFNSSFDTTPHIDSSSLRKSKIGTPQSGFSMRSTSGLSSTWGGSRFNSTF